MDVHIVAGPCAVLKCVCVHSKFRLVPAGLRLGLFEWSPCSSCGHTHDQHHKMAPGAASPPPTRSLTPQSAQSSGASTGSFISNSTPIKISASSGRHLADTITASSLKKTSVSATNMRGTLAAELDGKVYIDVEGMEGYLWRDRPGQQQQLSAGLEHLVMERNLWKPPPLPNHSGLLPDDRMPAWITQTLNAIAGVSPGTPAYTWLDSRSYSVSTGFSTRRSPDFCLVPKTLAANPQQQQQQVSFATMLVVGEHQSSPKTDVHAFLQLADYASHIFTQQPLRWYVHGLLSYNKHPGGLRLFIFDRGGVVGSCLLPLTLPTMTHLAAAYADIPMGNLGFPPSPADRISIPLPGPGGQRATIGRTLCSRPGIVCRGTYCALAQLGTTQLLVKYSWRSEARGNEGELLQLAAQRGVIGVARHVAHEDLVDVATLRRGLVEGSGRAMVMLAGSNKNNNSGGSKGGGRKGSNSGSKGSGSKGSASGNTTTTTTGTMSLTNRVYTRIIMSTIGTPIEHLTAPLPVAQALLGALIGHASLFFTGRILHRDVSASNILYTPIPLPIDAATALAPPYPLNGFLIDLDYAIPYPPTAASGAPHRTGTLPFMSIGVLSAEPHTYRHDLESFLYVLLWVATAEAIPEWMDGGAGLIAAVKRGQMTGDRSFEELLGRFTEAFSGKGGYGLKEVARRWREVLFCYSKGGEDLPVLWLVGDGQRGMVKPGMSELEGFGEMKEALEMMVREGTR